MLTPHGHGKRKDVEVLDDYTEPHLRHYRFCRYFSVACPEGEVGDVHVSTVLCLISRAFFEAIRVAGWQMEAGQRPLSAPPGEGSIEDMENLFCGRQWAGA